MTRPRRARREEPGLVRLLAPARTASRSRGATASTSCRTARYTPLHVHMALIQAKDGTLYATIIYPFTLLRIEPKEYK